MVFSFNAANAARRNLEAAESLDNGNRRDVAGYLYGIAAECAIKALMLEIAIRDKDVLYAHFPELRTRLRDLLQGRRAQPLAKLIANDAFMNNWDIKMRYAHATEVLPGWVDTWRGQARHVVGMIGSL